MHPPADQPIFILGTGVLAEEVHALATDAGVAVAGFVENLDQSKDGSSLCGEPIIWVDRLEPGSPCICALSTTRRHRFIDQVRDRARFVTFVHPSSVILTNTTLGAGTLISTGVLVASNTRIGQQVFVNRGARIGHHTTIGDFCSIQPGANIAGRVELGRATFVGLGAIILDRLRVGAGATIAAGAVVVKDVPARTLVAGHPAAVKRTDHAAP